MSNQILYLDQNAWITLARGSWDQAAYPADHAALCRVVEAVEAGRATIPLSYANIYETAKVNDPIRRAHLARVQATLSGGIVFRGRRRILREALRSHLAKRLSLSIVPLPERWFLSDLWFEAAADYTPETFDVALSEDALTLIRENPAYALFDFLVGTEADDEVRMEGVRRYSASSNELIAGIEARRGLAAGESFAVRLRAYAARLLIDEYDFILATGRELGLTWTTLTDFGPSLMKSIVSEVPVMEAERQLAVRLEDQKRPIAENDLRDMSAFTTVLPLADIMVAEKAFVNLARQAGLDSKYGTTLLVSLDELAAQVI